MITPGKFIEILHKNELGPFIGVPCSILSPLINYVLDNPSDMDYLNPANEAHALGLAAGCYLATNKIPVVFSQNSGLGNMINPLTSLSQIYRIPTLLLITWRGFGEPGSDAPEHDIVGRDLKSYLEVLHLPNEILSENDYSAQITKLANIARNEEIPVTAIVKKNLLDTHEPSNEATTGTKFQRYEAIEIIKESLSDFVFFSTTGFISRESFAVKDTPDFYMVGSMGLISAIGCGVALLQEKKRIAILDGDGAILMHLGLIPFIGSRQPKNLFHFILDNQTYASTQNQPTISSSVEFDKIALSSGYRGAYKASSGKELSNILKSMKDAEGPALIWIKVAPGNRSEAGRISHSPEEIKKRFMKAL